MIDNYLYRKRKKNMEFPELKPKIIFEIWKYLNHWKFSYKKT